jgi:uncharacterized protein YkwD
MPTLLALFLCAVATFPASAQNTRTVSGAFDYDKARQVVSNLNRLRQSQGLKSLKMETALTEAAMLRAAELAFREEEEQEDEVAAGSGKRPNGEKNIQLIAEQYHVAQMNVACQYVHLSKRPFTDISTVVKVLKGNNSSTLLSSSYQSVGCGSFLSSNGFYYWVIYLLPNSNGKAEVPTGQQAVEVRIALKPGEKTETIARTKSDTDLTPTGFEVTGYFNYTKAIRVVELTNKERAANGLKPLIMDSTLMELAMLRAAELKANKNMKHIRPNGETGYSVIDETWGIVLTTGENIARGQESAEELVGQWMNSPGHRRNILYSRFNRMGAGECNGYWVQLFAESDRKTPALSKSAARTDEVVVFVTIVPGEVSKVVKRKKVE